MMVLFIQTSWALVDFLLCWAPLFICVIICNEDLILNTIVYVIVIYDNLEIMIYIIILYHHLDTLRCYSLKMWHIIKIIFK
jgi:hypothetical protein